MSLDKSECLVGLRRCSDFLRAPSRVPHDKSTVVDFVACLRAFIKVAWRVKRDPF